MSNEYDDVMGFEIPEEPPEPNSSSEGIEDLSEFKEVDDSFTKTNTSTISDDIRLGEDEEFSIYNEISNETPESISKTPEEQINEAVPTEKKDAPPEKPKRKINEAKKLNKKLLFKITGILVAFFVVVFIVLPNFKTEEVKQNEELDKASSTYIPKDVERLSNEYGIPDTGTAEPIETKNVVLEIPEEDVKTTNLEELFPPPGEKISSNTTPPVQTQQSTITETRTVIKAPIIDTARNEQQKELTRKSLPDLSLGGKTYSSSNTASFPANNTNGYVPQSLNSLQQISELLSTQGNATGNAGLTSNDSYFLQNNQSNKQDFFDSSNTDAGKYKMNSKYSIYKGTIITAVLDTAINTDLPGNVTAHVTKNVYSSFDGQYLIIPQGSTIFGEYNSTVSYGQKRVQVIWNTIIRPDGLEIDIGRMNGVDKNGYSGYEGIVNDHPFEYLKAMGLITCYSILDTKMSILQEEEENKYAQNVMTDVYAETQKLNNEMLKRALDIQPTITIPAKSVINVVTNVTMTLPPLEIYEVTEKYVR